mgnify:CR=1 FL=1
MQHQREWGTLFKIGAIAAMVASLLFRRNIGAEVSLFIGTEAIPVTIQNWYAMLQERPFIALSLLSFFDLVNYFLVAVILVALAALVHKANKGIAVLALSSGLIGVALNLSSNISLTLLSLSQQYASAVSEVQKAELLDAGQSILAGNNPLAEYPATGVLVSLLLIAAAVFMLSLLMLQTHRATAIIGLIASGCDLLYCVVFPLTLIAPVYLLLAVAGFFWMVWHFLIALKLLKSGKNTVE